MGLVIECPVCEAQPPKDLGYTSRKWRWMTVHIAEHKARLKKV